MKRKNQWIIFGVLLTVLGAVAYLEIPRSESPAGAPQASATNERFTPLSVDNPALRMDILKRFLALEYTGAHRNIFTATLPLPPAPPVVPVQVVAAPQPVVNPGPPPLTVEAKYFGYVSDAGGSHRKAFFATANNEDVFIAGEGDTLMGHFQVIRISATQAVVEEVSTGRSATLVLEEPGPNG